MLLKKYSSLLSKNNSTFLLIIFILFTSIMSAQNDTLFFDANWKKCNKEIALFYRIKPIKIKTKDAIEYKIKDVDSLYVINDYFIKSNKLQFEGYSTDKEANYLVGKAQWYNENNTLLGAEDFKYKTYNKSKFEFPKWPILYLNYKIATKSQFIGGLEFCLDCENRNKFFLGLGYGLTSYNSKYYGLPDLHLSYNTPNFLFIKGGVSDKHAYALAGFTVLNVLDLGFGYSQPFNKDKIPVIKGFTFGATIRLSSNQKAYTQLKFM